MIFMIIMIYILKQSTAFKRDLTHLFATPIQLIAIIVAGYVITLNWGHLFGLCQMDMCYKPV